jgi:hypothetical protein
MKPTTILALLATCCLAASAGAAELKLLSQGLPETAYTGGDNKWREGNEPAKVFDGDLKSAFCNGPAYPAWVMVDLGADYKIIKIMTFMERSGTWYGYKLEVSSDQQTWAMFADQTKNQEPSEDPAYTDMGMMVGRYVRLTLTDAPHRDKGWFWPVPMECQVFGVAPEPEKL